MKWQNETRSTYPTMFRHVLESMYLSRMVCHLTNSLYAFVICARIIQSWINMNKNIFFSKVFAFFCHFFPHVFCPITPEWRPPLSRLQDVVPPGEGGAPLRGQWDLFEARELPGTRRAERRHRLGRKDFIQEWTMIGQYRMICVCLFACLLFCFVCFCFCLFDLSTYLFYYKGALWYPP